MTVSVTVVVEKIFLDLCCSLRNLNMYINKLSYYRINTSIYSNRSVSNEMMMLKYSRIVRIKSSGNSLILRAGSPKTFFVVERIIYLNNLMNNNKLYQKK